MGKYKHKNGKVGSRVALNMLKANSSQPFSLTSSPVNQGDGKSNRKIRKLLKTTGQLMDMSMAEFGETGGPNHVWLGDEVNRKWERKVKKNKKTAKQVSISDLNKYIDDYRSNRSPVNQGDGSRLKKKINKLSDKHKGLHDAVIEGHGQNEYTSGDYDRDMKKLHKVEDKLERKEKKYQEKFGESPYAPEISEEFKEATNRWLENSLPRATEMGRKILSMQNTPLNQAWHEGGSDRLFKTMDKMQKAHDEGNYKKSLRKGRQAYRQAARQGLVDPGHRFKRIHPVHPVRKADPLPPLNKEGWIQDVTASIKERGTKGVCTGDKFGSASCPPGSKRYNLAKTFKKIAKNR